MPIEGDLRSPGVGVLNGPDFTGMYKYKSIVLTKSYNELAFPAAIRFEEGVIAAPHGVH